MSEESTWREHFTPKRVIGFLIALVLCLVLLPATEADEETSRAVTAQVAARELSKSLRESASTLDDARPIHLLVRFEGAPELEEPILGALRHEDLVLQEARTPETVGDVRIGTNLPANEVTVNFALKAPKLEAPVMDARSSRVGGWEAVLPPLIALLVALFFRRLILALVLAVWIGGTAMMDWNPVYGLWRGATNYVWGSVADSFNIYIILFTLCLVGMVQVITRMGGILGVLNKFSRLAESVRSTRVTTALLGTAIFFDDYANTVVVGTSMRPITDARKISREKLAYLVDSMSAPIAGVAIISTWIGYEVGLFDELSAQLALDRSGYDIFFTILPLRFYCFLTIFFVLANAWLGRDYGPMLKAERRALGGEVLREGSTPLTSVSFGRTEPKPDIEYRWYNALIPIGVVIVTTIFGMYWSGWTGEGGASIPGLFDGPDFAVLGAALRDMADWQAWRSAFSNADGGKVLFFSAVVGSLTAMGLGVSQKLLTPREAFTTWGSAVPAMWLAVLILVMAWSIRAVCDDLGTSIYLVGAVQDILAPAALPLITFLLAAVVAFATGTSWGTMGILLPAMIPLAFYLTQGDPSAQIILFLTFGAVLDGAIFGDHCSPISDTTVMSSISAACDHLDHVRTQLPYATTTMTFAATLGYVGTAYGLPVWLAYVLGIAGILAVLFLLGREAQFETPNTPEKA